jgi:hypothetical protein
MVKSIMKKTKNEERATAFWKDFHCISYSGKTAEQELKRKRKGDELCFYPLFGNFTISFKLQMT